MKESEVLRLFVNPEHLHPKVQIYLLQLFEKETSRRNLSQTRTRRNKEGKIVEAGYVLMALHLHTVVTDYITRMTEKDSN